MTLMTKEMEHQQNLQETKQHGAVWFPFNIYPCTIPKDFPQVALHWQESMEIVFVKKGQGVVQAGSEAYHAQAGDIYIFAPGVLHALRQEKNETMEYENIIFDLELLGGAGDVCAERYLMPLQSGRFPLPVFLREGMDGYEQAKNCLCEAEEANRTKETGYELLVKGALFRFLGILVLHGGQIAIADTPDTRRLKQVLQLVTERFGGALHIEEVAELCGYSKSHFMRWFRKMTGQSFVTYLNEQRLSASASMLRSEDCTQTILAIAGSCGFENLSYFNRMFKRRYGMTPREYRGKILNTRNV